MNLHIYLKCGKCQRYQLNMFDNVSANSRIRIDLHNWLELADSCPGCESKEWQMIIEPQAATTIIESESDRQI